MDLRLLDDICPPTEHEIRASKLALIRILLQAQVRSETQQLAIGLQTLESARTLVSTQLTRHLQQSGDNFDLSTIVNIINPASVKDQLRLVSDLKARATRLLHLYKRFTAETARLMALAISDHRARSKAAGHRAEAIIKARVMLAGMRVS